MGPGLIGNEGLCQIGVANWNALCQSSTQSLQQLNFYGGNL